MTMAKRSAARAERWMFGATIGIALAAPVCGASDAATREPIERESSIFDAAGVASTDDGQQLWGRQPGTSGFDAARSVATEVDGNVYIAGLTEGALGGPNKGDVDAFVIKYNGDGRRLWARQPGTSLGDTANGIATDVDGNVYIVGGTEGALGGPNKGDFDAFITKYDGDGNRLWARQPGSGRPDSARGVATDSEGNIYVVGGTEGALGGPNKGDSDTFLIKYDGGGHRLWARQPGTSGFDVAYAIATDADNNVYVAGDAGELTGRDKQGAFVIKYNGDGHQLWARQPATNEGSIAWGVSADENGSVYIAGSTIDGLGGPYKGTEDAFVIKYDLDGHVVWLQQFGTNVNVGGDFPQGVAASAGADGNVYVAGLTWGALVGPNKGGGDAFVIKFTGSRGAAEAVPGS